MNQEKIGKFIAALRKERSMTQKELAQCLAVSDKTISKWETGRGLPEISIMLSLCNVLDISINELLSGERLDVPSYREKAEENIVILMQCRSYKKIAIHIAISTALFLIAFITFPLAAEKIISPASIPIVLFSNILLVVGNLMAGITYGYITKWGKIRLFCILIYNVFLLFILITIFVTASIVFYVS